MLTFDQFAEIVGEEVDRYVSRDLDVCAEDHEWENGNLAIALAKRLRINGINLPDPET